MRKHSPHTFCRTCLNEFQQQQPTYNVQTMDFQIRQWLQDSTIQNPLIIDTFPKFVCHLCRDKLESFLEFHKMSLRSRQLFEEMMDKKPHIHKQTQEIKDVDGSAGQQCNDGEVNCDWLEFDFVAIPKSLTESQKETGKEEIPVEKDEPSFCSINLKTEDSMDDMYNNYSNDVSCDQQINTEQEADRVYKDQTIKSELCTMDISSDDWALSSIKTTKPTKSKKTKCTGTPKSKRQRKEKSTSDETPQHVCEECGKVYKSLVKLIEHQYSHKPLEEYPFHCTEPDCGKAFKTRSSFQEHKLRHDGIKNFHCHLCDMKKTSKKELDIHINYHTKERQWLCPKCSMIFYSANDLRSHDKIVHLRIRRFFCRFCDQAFAKNYALKHHEMRHTGEKPHVCTECNKGFIQMVSLRTHLKTHKLLAENKSTAEAVKAND